MRRLLLLLLGVALAAPVGAVEPSAAGAFATGHYRNLFKEYLGKSDAEIDARVQSAWRQLFAGDPATQRLYYPVGGDMAYIPDVGNRDVRTEGLSYGMMICVQLGHQPEFNALWKFARTHMYHEQGPLRGYFTWHTAYNGTMTRDDGSEVRGGGPAPDGEEWFVTALFFASHRWGDREGIFNYGAEAQALLHTMLHKHEEPGRENTTDMFDRETKQIVFTPHPPGDKFTDASYHLPAFYELWARWATAPEDRVFLAEVAKTSRAFFRKSAHPQTGLMPNYAGFDAQPFGRRWAADEFREDAWRTLSNPALDWSWWAADPWEQEQSNRVLAFFAKQPPDDWPDHIRTDGTPLRSGQKSAGLYAMAATAGLAADPVVAKPFVQRLWDLKMPDDTGRNHDGLRKEGELRSWRYYDGLLTMLALLEVSGNFRIYGPVAK